MRRHFFVGSLAVGAILLTTAFSTVVATSPLPGVPEPATSTPPSSPEAPFRFPAKDAGLQADLDELLRNGPYARLARQERLSVALVDLSRPGEVRYAGFADDRMQYAASLPKIAVMLTVFDRLEAGGLEDGPRLRERLQRMIRHSDNRAASELIRAVGFDRIADVLRDPDYRLYDADRNGGLWVGKGYGGGVGRWRRDPLHGVSHGATARQVARFLAMMDRGELVSPRASKEMKRLMSRPAIEHKFVAGLRKARPSSRIFRKSGTWKSWHADAAIVERGDLRYGAVVLAHSRRGGPLLSDLIVDLDGLVSASGEGPSPGPERVVR